ncbi:hypothetical protein PA25_14780 [Pseudoalteromonas sp. A25]|uniref:hypothetical protein n=1 Tax=Pseudoalteromonas sp. A25 TaxID=116092 RepID=UPI0012604F2B|nr:hypothetical protein [Pseudoalteromonas sp. A25]BBN81493.1 hypothetical protein PA25_14780 [Pseudoalteromonas sp. A25]
MIRSVVAITAAIMGVLSLANGIFMVISPEPWYWAVPGVAERGPFNQHFIRDLGFIYGLIGSSYLCGLLYISQRVALWCLSSAWLVCHAIFHIWEIWVGICGPEFFLIDFGGVTLPALVSVGLVYRSYSRAENDL